MHLFIDTFSTVGGVVAAIVGGIIALTVFFRVLWWLTGGSKPEAIALRGVLKKDTFAAVHLLGGETFERVRLVGFTNSESMKTTLPYDLNGMVILEDERGQRYLVRAKSIRMIVVSPDTGGG